MEIQLDPRGIRVRLSSGWHTFTAGQPVEDIISALISDRNKGAGLVPADSLGTLRLAPATNDGDLSADHIQGTAVGKLRKVPADPRLRRVLAQSKPKVQAIGMTLEDLLSD